MAWGNRNAGYSPVSKGSYVSLPSQITLIAPLLAASAEWPGLGETSKVKVEVCWQHGMAERLELLPLL